MESCASAVCCGAGFGIVMICALCAFDSRETSVSNVALRLAIETPYDLALSNVAFN